MKVRQTKRKEIDGMKDPNIKIKIFKSNQGVEGRYGVNLNSSEDTFLLFFSFIKRKVIYSDRVTYLP